MGTRTPTQVKNYFYDSKKTIAKQKENRAKITKGCPKSATRLKKKEIAVKMTTKIAQASIDENNSALFRAVSSNSKDCYSDREFMELSLQRVQGHDQQEQCHQHHFRLHHHQQQQQQQFQHQQIHLQQQQLESLVQQQQQEEMYRQQMQQEDMYRQHLQLQQQHYAKPGHNWNQLDRKSTCELVLLLRHISFLFLFFRPTTSKFAINVVSAPF